MSLPHRSTGKARGAVEECFGASSLVAGGWGRGGLGGMQGGREAGRSCSVYGGGEGRAGVRGWGRDGVWVLLCVRVYAPCVHEPNRDWKGRLWFSSVHCRGLRHFYQSNLNYDLHLCVRASPLNCCAFLCTCLGFVVPRNRWRKGVSWTIVWSPLFTYDHDHNLLEAHRELLYAYRRTETCHVLNKACPSPFNTQHLLVLVFAVGNPSKALENVSRKISFCAGEWSCVVGYSLCNL